MRTEEFIKKCSQGEYNGKQKTVASVYFDGKTLYSYGYHYPLLININNKWILNDRGYSSTTAKHIAYARQVSDGVVNLQGLRDIDRATIVKCINLELDDIILNLEKLSKRAFRQKQILEDRREKLENTLTIIK